MTARSQPLATNQIELRSGIVASLRELRQSSTYEGLLEGLPTRERNQQHLEQLQAEYCTHPFHDKPHLVPPTESPIDIGEPYPFGTPARLPAVTCVARFTARQPVRDPRAHYSSLTVIWLQDTFAWPPEPPALEQLQAIDWAALASDREY
jgi:hypothetical protein